MKGVIKTFFSDKGYGFIKGEDKKDYFFHFNDLDDLKEAKKIVVGAQVNCYGKESHNGLSAYKISFVKVEASQESEKNTKYVVPETLYINTGSTIPGWEVLEEGLTLTHTFRGSPSDAKALLNARAKFLGANAIFDFNFYDTTESEKGTGSGIHYFSLHHVSGVPACIAKKRSGATLSREDIIGVLSKSIEINKTLEKKVSERKQTAIMLFLLGGAGGIWLLLHMFIFGLLALLVLVPITYKMYKNAKNIQWFLW